MRFIPFTLALFFVLICLLSSCRKYRTSDIEKQRITEDTILTLPSSTVALPVRYELSYFEAWLNEMIRGKFMDKAFSVNADRDSLWLELERIGRIQLAIRNQKIFIDVPVKASGTYKTSILGIGIQNRRPVSAEIVLKLQVDAKLNEKWKLVTSTTLDTIIWVEEPRLRVVGINFDIKNFINRIFERKEDEFLTRLDEVFYNDIDFRRVIGKVWNDLQKPIHIVKQDPHAWLLMKPEKIFGRVILTDPRALVFDLAIEMKAEARVFHIDSSFARTALPDLIHTHTIDEFELIIQGSIPYKETAKYIQSLVSEVPVSAQGYSIVIDSLEIFGTSEGLAVRVDCSGDIDGHVYVVGMPKFDPVSKQMLVEQFDYEVFTDNILVSTAADLLYTQVIERVQNYLYIDLEDHISDLPGLISTAIDTGKVGDKISLYFDTLNIEDVEILLSAKDLQFNVRTGGKARLDIERLNVKRRLFISD